MPTQSFANRWADKPAFRGFPRYAGALIACFGVLVIVSWYAHWRPVIQMLPNTAPMQVNTAICFALLGSGLVLLTTRRAELAPWLAGIAALVGLATLIEYILGVDLGIDQLFLRPYFFEAKTAFPGRMAPLAAVCHLLSATAIALISPRVRLAHRNTIGGMIACVVTVVALVALLGFIFGVDSAYSWGSYSTMAFNTAVAFLLLSWGLLAWSWQLARREEANFIRWVPIACSATLMVMITLVSAVIMGDLERAIFWRTHTIQVILRAQAFEENLIDLQRGVRGYVTTGDPAALASREVSMKLEQALFKELADLTADNASQQSRLVDLNAAMAGVFSFEKRLLAAYRDHGGAGVAALDATGEDRSAFGRAREILKAFSREERGLLEVRDASEKGDVHSSGSLFVFGSATAALLLLAANYLVGREMAERKRVEDQREKLIDELRLALEEVKTLSGIIPICGWCKNIRSDEGYWHSVEQYVHAHTEATFTHGICPACSEKMRMELASLAAKGA